MIRLDFFHCFFSVHFDSCCCCCHFRICRILCWLSNNFAHLLFTQFTAVIAFCSIRLSTQPSDSLTLCWCLVFACVCARLRLHKVVCMRFMSARSLSYLLRCVNSFAFVSLPLLSTPTHAYTLTHTYIHVDSMRCWQRAY